MLFEILKNLSKFHDSDTTSWITNHEKIEIYKTLIKLRFAKINLREKSTGSQFAKLNPREMFKRLLAKINSRENFSPQGNPINVYTRRYTEATLSELHEWVPYETICKG